LFWFLLTQIPFVGLVLLRVLSPQMAATPASIACFLLFLWYLNRAKESIAFYKSDIFYAGLLTAAMIWIMFYFA
jgi:solute:Na+ symporter, SSS family